MYFMIINSLIFLESLLHSKHLLLLTSAMWSSLSHFLEEEIIICLSIIRILSLQGRSYTIEAIRVTASVKVSALA